MTRGFEFFERFWTVVGRQGIHVRLYTFEPRSSGVSPLSGKARKNENARHIDGAFLFHLN